MKKEELGIYIHIPFCKKKCYYCDFISYCNKSEFVDDYIKCLKNEIINFAQRHKDIYDITTIYIGGGTPSSIEEKYIKDIIDTIDENLVKIKDIKEITIEVNPGTITKQKLEQYKSSGINRISIGLQSTNNKLLEEKRAKYEFIPTVSHGSSHISAKGLLEAEDQADKNMYEFKKKNKLQ